MTISRKWYVTPKGLKHRIQGQLISDKDKALLRMDSNVEKRLKNGTLIEVVLRKKIKE
jgi:hypothetical protein